jgi:exodeoxyribonuclease-5
MCLKNNKQLGLFNGMQGIVRSLYEDEHGRMLMDFESDDFLFPGIWYDEECFGQEKPSPQYYEKDHPNPFDYASVITAHKSQGSEYDRVMVLDQHCTRWCMRRWRYTSASRAKQKLFWAH